MIALILLSLSLHARAVHALSRRLPQKLLSSSLKGGLGASSDTSSLTVKYLSTGVQVTYSHSEALFGVPAYGGGVQARVYYPSDPNPNVNTGCTPLASETTPPNSVIVLDRGGPAGCTFTSKVLNAQRAGAVGAIIVDSIGVCFKTADCPRGSDACRGCPLYQTSTQCQCDLPVMADDGSGSLVNIPSFLVGRDDGAAIKVAATDASKNRPPKAIAALKWDIPDADGRAAMAMWQDSNDIVAYQFRDSFKPYIPYLEGSVDFVAHYLILDGRAEGCNGFYDCGNQCINGGYYCAADPDGDVTKGVSGADVVVENLRQICVWQVRPPDVPFCPAPFLTLRPHHSIHRSQICRRALARNGGSTRTCSLRVVRGMHPRGARPVPRVP